MRLLVTGASGFIGRNVLLRAPRGWEIFAVYNRTPDLETFRARSGLANVVAVRCDLTSPDQVGALIRRTGAVDCCLHLAANGDPTRSAIQPALDLQMNTLALVTLLEQLRANRFVFVSSGAVYDGLSGEVTPETAVAPRLPYAIAKLASEQYVRASAERNATVGSYLNVRFFGAYGPFEPARKITTRCLLAAMNGQREFSVRGDGRNLIDFMFVDDAVEGLLRVMQTPEFSGTIDFASGTPLSVDEVVTTVARVIGIAAVIRHEGHTEEYIRFRSADRAMRDRFGFVPAVPLEDGLRWLHQHLLQERRGAGQSA
jgi:nucleoside-diphosphate-sugar epimerase